LISGACSGLEFVPSQPRERQVDERREGVMIASACPLDENSLVHFRLGLDTTGMAVCHRV